MARLGVLISGGGTNLQALIDACQDGSIRGEVVVVISNNEDAYGLTRAQNHGIVAHYLEDEKEILDKLSSHKVDIVVLAGYLRLIQPSLLKAYPNRVVNIHPSLIPSFSGKGYYGLRVHEAAIKRGVKLSGATVHLVNEIYDEGEILDQESVPVYENDSAQDLQKRVLEVEHKIYARAIEKLIDKEGLE